MILVTGGAGFIGSNFIHNWFTNSEEPIIALDKLTYAGNLGNLEVLKGRSNFRFVRTDISNRKIIKKLLRDEKPRAVVGLEDTINPASPAAPPEADVIVAPSTLNWKPAISPSLE